jgi:hypothetical protein
LVLIIRAIILDPSLNVIGIEYDIGTAQRAVSLSPALDLDDAADAKDVLALQADRAVRDGEAYGT